MLRSTLLLASFLTLAIAAPGIKRDDPIKAFTIASKKDGKCLSLPNGDSTQPADGIALVSMDCDTASGWILDRGSGSVLLAADQGYALDAGENPGDHGGLKIWTSYPGLMQQTWYYTDDDRIAITGGTQCLDEGDNGPQTYTCQTGNDNQAWSTTEIDYCD